MTSVHWLDDVSGGFTDASAWGGGVVPGAGAVAVLDAPGTIAYTVTVTASGTVAGVQTAANATLDIAAGSFTAQAATHGGANAGTLFVGGGATLTAAGTLDNAGALDLEQTSQKACLQLTSAGLTLTGGGLVNLENPIDYTDPNIPCPTSDSLDWIIGQAGAVLTNVDNTITGSASIGQGALGLVNEAAGVIDASLTTDLILTDLVGAVVNGGLMEATGSGGLYLQRETIDQTSGGTIAADGGIVYLGAVDIIGGTFTSSGAGRVFFDNNDSVIDGSAPGGVVNKGLLFVGPDGGAATLHGDVINEGTIGVDGPEPTPATVFIGADGVSLTGGGVVALYGPDGASRIVGLTASATLTNWDNTIVGQGQVGAGELTLVNAAGGVIEAINTTPLTVDTGANTLANAGVFEASGMGTLVVDGVINDTAGGTIQAEGGYGNVILSAATIIGGVLRTANGGVMLSDDAVLDGRAARLANLGTVQVAAGESLTLEGSIANAGEILLTGASVSGTNKWAELTIGQAGVTLTGGGLVELGGGGLDIVTGRAPGAILTNASGAIAGAGNLGHGALGIVNAAGALIDANAAAWMVVNSGTAGLANAGLIESSAGGRLEIDSTAVVQSGGGAISAASGIIALYGAEITGGAVSAAAGQVVFHACDLAGVTLSVTGAAGSVHFASGANSLDGLAAAVTNLNRLILNNGASVTIAGVIDNAGSVELVASGAATALVVAAAGATLTGGGKVLLGNTALGDIRGASSTATLVNAETLQGGGAVGMGAMSLVNSGVIDANQSTALTIDTGANTVVNSGVIEAMGAGAVVIAGAVANSGALTVNGGALTVNGAVSGTGKALIANGTMTFAAAFSESVTFNGKSGTLALARSQTYGGAISGFSHTGTTALDLEDIAFASGVTKASYSGTTAGGVLTVTDGTHTAKIALIGAYLGSTFTLSSDGHGGTRVVDPAAPAAPVALAQAMAGFQHDPPPHLAATAAYSLPRFPMFHARA